MKITPTVWLTATLSATTILADTFEIEWYFANGRQAIFSSWTSDSKGIRESVTRLPHEGCVDHPGPVDMQQLCLYSGGGYGWFFYEGASSWRCIRRTYREGSDDADGREVWSEVSCDW